MLRVGIIGTGAISNLNILGYIHSQDSELVAVADTDVKIAGEKLERWGLRSSVKIYTDYKKMVDKEDLDVVEILTPHHLHYPMTEYCAKAEIPGISVQKPMAHTIKDCDKMIQVCKEEKIKLKIFENFRFYPVYLKAKELLEQNIIGKLLNFRIITIETGGPGMHRELKELVWRQKVDSCGGGPMVYDDGIHKFSMALWLMGEERVEKVYSWIDYFTAVIDMPATIFWKYPTRNPDDPPKFGSMEFKSSVNLYFPSNYYNCDEFIEISGTKGMIWLNQCTSGGNFISKTPEFPPIVVYINGKVTTYGEELPRDWRYSFINSTEHFIEVIKSGKGEPIYDGKMGLNLSIFAKMPYISNQQNRIVNWEEITVENEDKGFCAVEEPKNIDPRGYNAFFRRKKADLKKGINQGLKNTVFKYQYEI